MLLLVDVFGGQLELYPVAIDPFFAPFLGLYFEFLAAWATGRFRDIRIRVVFPFVASGAANVARQMLFR